MDFEHLKINAFHIHVVVLAAPMNYNLIKKGLPLDNFISTLFWGAFLEILQNKDESRR